uniref:Uncharacterized protein n=1 Tax=Anguilla anguilla TaxID=7936 RepID=A0A0E9W072_ANGAN
MTKCKPRKHEGTPRNIIFSCSVNCKYCKNSVQHCKKHWLNENKCFCITLSHI